MIAAKSIHKNIAALSMHLFLRPGTSFRKEIIENILEVKLIPAIFLESLLVTEPGLKVVL